MVLPKELKQAISDLTGVEKDKLIFRLLKKDIILAKRLIFELVGTNSVEEQRLEIQQKLKAMIQRATSRFYSPSYLNVDVREMSGEITLHVRITRDKYGEAYLNLYLLNQILELNTENLQKSKSPQKFYVAILARAFKVLILLSKLHADLLVEFKEDLKKLGYQIGNNHSLMKLAINHGLDVNWLISAEIPDDLIAHHTELKNMGFLR